MVELKLQDEVLVELAVRVTAVTEQVTVRPEGVAAPVRVKVPAKFEVLATAMPTDTPV